MRNCNRITGLFLLAALVLAVPAYAQGGGGAAAADLTKLDKTIKAGFRNHYDPAYEDRLFGATNGQITMLEQAVTGSANDGAANGTGVTATEAANGLQKTTLTFVNTPVVLADNAGVVAYGSLKIYDMPQGWIWFHHAIANLAITKSATGVNVDWDGDIGLGTVAANNGNTLATTEQDLIPTTATPQAAAGATTGDMVSTATEDYSIFDGTATPVDVYVNILVDDADHDVTGTPTNLILNGTITIFWVNGGDN